MWTEFPRNSSPALGRRTWLCLPTAGFQCVPRMPGEALHPQLPVSSVFIFSLSKLLTSSFKWHERERELTALNPTQPPYPPPWCRHPTEAPLGSWPGKCQGIPGLSSSVFPGTGRLLMVVAQTSLCPLIAWSREKTVMQAKESDIASPLLPDLLGCGGLTLEM